MAPDHDLAGCRLQDPRDALEEGRLPGAVAADDAEGLPCFDLESDVSQRPEVLVRDVTRMQDPFFQRGVLLLIETEPLGDVLNVDRGLQWAQSSSAKLPSTLPKTTIAPMNNSTEMSRMIESAARYQCSPYVAIGIGWSFGATVP